MDFLAALGALAVFVLFPFVCIAAAFFSVLEIEQLWHLSVDLGHWFSTHLPRLGHHV
jgi:hypothetical protein